MPIGCGSTGRARSAGLTAACGRRGLHPTRTLWCAAHGAPHCSVLAFDSPSADTWHMPPPSPTQATRRQWAPLVRHCRESGGDRAFERTGASLRHGLGVGHAQHAAYLSAIGLQPETTADGCGGWAGGLGGGPGWEMIHVQPCCLQPALDELPCRRVECGSGTQPLSQHLNQHKPALVLHTAACRAWVGDVPGLAPPLQEPEHAFSTYYRQVRR